MSIEAVIAQFRALVPPIAGEVITDLPHEPAGQRIATAVENDTLRTGAGLANAEVGLKGGVLRAGKDKSGWSTSQLTFEVLPADPGTRIPAHTEPSALIVLILAIWFGYTALGVVTNLLNAIAPTFEGRSVRGDEIADAVGGMIAFAFGFVGAAFIRIQVRRDHDLMLAFIAKVVGGRVVASHQPTPGPMDISAPRRGPDPRNKPIVS